jgi:hypothetical protein
VQTGVVVPNWGMRVASLVLLHKDALPRPALDPHLPFRKGQKLICFYFALKVACYTGLYASWLLIRARGCHVIGVYIGEVSCGRRCRLLCARRILACRAGGKALLAQRKPTHHDVVEREQRRMCRICRWASSNT